MTDFTARRNRHDQAIAVVVEEWIDMGQYPTCTNCEFYAHDSEVCTKYQAKPPAKVIVKGCSTWEYNIPF